MRHFCWQLTHFIVDSALQTPILTRMAGTSIDVANEFIRLADERDRSLTPMQLQKLVYIAHGWRLALTGSALTTDHVQAWEFGPVYPELYKKLRRYGGAGVDQQISTPDNISDWWSGWSGSPRALNEDDKKVIDRVYEVYGQFPAYKLSALTHEANTPWSQAYVPNANKTIEDKSIQEHFEQLALERA